MLKVYLKTISHTDQAGQAGIDLKQFKWGEASGFT